jgi:hypothetical protein
MTARLWTVMRDGQVATCDAVPTPEAGLQLVVTVQGREAWRTPVTRDDLSAEWRATFVSRGWQDLPSAEPVH